MVMDQTLMKNKLRQLRRLLAKFRLSKLRKKIEPDVACSQSIQRIDAPLISTTVRQIINDQIKKLKALEPVEWTRRGPWKPHYNSHADDTRLHLAIQEKPLDAIVGRFRYLYATPLLWTHRHEKLLHVVWKIAPAPMSPLPDIPLPGHRYECKCNMRPSRKRNWHRFAQQIVVEARREATRPERETWWALQHQPWVEPLRQKFPSVRTPLPSSPSSFVLVKEEETITSTAICSLRNCWDIRPYASQREAMQVLLSGVDESDSLDIFDHIPISRQYLRLEEQDLDIMYGTMKHGFLPPVPVYRLATKRGGSDWADIEEADGDAGKFWRLAHIDQAHITQGYLAPKKGAANFYLDGVRNGMSYFECTDRYEYEYEVSNWNHAHFIPGVFIAMAQRYRMGEWEDQGGEYGSPSDTDDDDTPPGADAARSRSPRDGPIWQVLLTDPLNDLVYAHLYTAQVPGCVLDSLETPARRRIADPAAGGRDTRPFTFPIHHTPIAYAPNDDTFRERLRTAIEYCRDNFHNRGRD
ncbi:hypothetical protein F4802DRAFT_505926 [Xylaria palmicola]|nr:hypothetical protein F4802DRAFT_505926 [Xylaria palmicola]